LDASPEHLWQRARVALRRVVLTSGAEADYNETRFLEESFDVGQRKHRADGRRYRDADRDAVDRCVTGVVHSPIVHVTLRSHATGEAYSEYMKLSECRNYE
jgi:hypothetical protein